MKIQRIEFKHTGPFLNFALDFQADPAVTLLYAAPGTGKTQFLKHLYHALTWFPARLKDLRTAGVAMLDQDISLQRIQSKIEITVQFPEEIGSFPVPSDQQAYHPQQCRWQLYKTLNAEGVGVSRAETLALEQLTDLYRKVIKADPLQGLPLIAYYPSTRFINEINLQSKNAPTTFQPQAAYEIATIPFFTFSKFFEWLREVSDLENAQSAQLLQQLLKQPLPLDLPELNQHFLSAQQRVHCPYLTTFSEVLSILFPECQQLELCYRPKLNLQLSYHGKTMLYQQLPASIKTWIALLGDVVRRACLLNPNSPHPCLDVQGILMIDDIDQGLSQEKTTELIHLLHQTFPQLQLIFTTSRAEILDLNVGYQCLHLQSQAAFPITPSWRAFEDWSMEAAPEAAPLEAEHLPAPASLELIYAQLSQYTPEELVQIGLWLEQHLAPHNAPENVQQKNSKSD